MAGAEQASEAAASEQQTDIEQDTGDEQPLDEEERKLGRWVALGLTAMLLGSMGGVLIELIFS